MTFLFYFAVRVNEQRIVAFLTEKCTAMRPNNNNHSSMAGNLNHIKSSLSSSKLLMHSVDLLLLRRPVITTHYVISVTLHIF